MYSIKTKGTETNKGRSTIHRWNIRVGIIKVLDKTTQSTMMLKLKFVQNVAMLDITNNG